MNMRRSRGYGYTIVEVMIFLAVSSALFLSASFLISGQQQRTEFTQGVRDLESQLQDIINDVSTGYYANRGNFSCLAAAGAAPTFAVGGNNQGANSGCIFIGRVVQFEPLSNSGRIRLYNVAGSRRNTNGTDVSTLAEAQPRVIDYPSIAGAADLVSLQAGLRIRSICYNTSPCTVASTNVGSIGYFTDFRSSTGAASGSRSVDLIAIPTTNLNQDEVTTAARIQIADAGAMNPTDGIVMCVQPPNGGQRGIITLGANGNPSSIKTVIEEGVCA